MASADYTSTGLVANVKRRAFLPAGSGLSTADILQVLTEQLRNYIPAFLKGIREEYLVAELRIAITGASNAIPARAVGAALRTVAWLGDGDTVPRMLARIEPERRAGYAATDGTPTGFLFQGNNLVLVPAVTSGTLVLTYQQRPGQLVTTEECGCITEINTGTRTLTFDSLPTTFTDAQLYDAVACRPNFGALELDISVDTVTTTTMVLTGAVPTGLLEGDYISLATETCIPQTPLEVHDLLAQAAASKIANSMGSTRKDAIKEALLDLRAEVSVILTPRSDGNARYVVSRSGLGLGWGGG